MRLFRDLTEGHFLTVRSALPGWLDPFQRAQLKKAAEQKMPSEFIAVITTGYSDRGGLGLAAPERWDGYAGFWPAIR